MSVLAALVVTLGMIVVPASTASASSMEPFPTGYSFLRARHSGKCLEVVGSSTANGALVQQATCVPGKASQLWRVSLPCGSNCYGLFVNKNSEKCLDLQSAPSIINGTAIMQYTCNDASRPTQRWQFLLHEVLNGPDAYDIRTVCCPVLYLTVSGASHAEGAPAIALTSAGWYAHHQQFIRG